MKIFLLASILVFSAIAQAQENPKDILVRFDAYCTDEIKLSEVLTKYNEVALLTMTSGRSTSGTVFHHPTVLFANASTGTWTLVEKLSTELYCVIGTGSNISPYTENQTVPDSPSNQQKQDLVYQRPLR